MKLRTKIASGFSVLLALVAVVGIVAMIQFLRMNVKEFYYNQQPKGY